MVVVGPLAWRASQGLNPETSRITMDAERIERGVVGGGVLVQRHVRQVDEDGRWLWLGSIERLELGGDWYADSRLRRSLEVDAQIPVQGPDAEQVRKRIEELVADSRYGQRINAWYGTVLLTAVAGGVFAVIGAMFAGTLNPAGRRELKGRV